MVLQSFCSKDIANFHRPKFLWYPHDNEVAVKEQGKLPTNGPMKIIVKSLGGKGSKLHVDAEETISAVKAKASKKLGCHLFFKSSFAFDPLYLCVYIFRQTGYLWIEYYNFTFEFRFELLIRAQAYLLFFWM